MKGAWGSIAQTLTVGTPSQPPNNLLKFGRHRADMASVAATANRTQPVREARWSGRPWAARGVRVTVHLVPFVASIGAAYALSNSMPTADSGVGILIRLACIILVATLVLALSDRLLRRALPLAALFELTLLFPDQAPSRFRVALRTGASNVALKERLARYQASGDDGPAAAAERLLELVGELSRHDRITRGHSERVRAYTQMIAGEMGIDGPELDRLRWAALIHDIGKLQISPDILNKPGSLTDSEFKIIQTHPELGARLAAPLAEWLGDSVLAVEQHHEKWDGTGYPHGLSGNAIARSARIVAVADVFDVMTSARSYKSARPSGDARAELARCAGTQFDPMVVRAFLNLSLRRLRAVMGPLSWLTQLSLFPQSLLGGAAVPVVNAATALAGFAAASVGALVLPGLGADASADATRAATPAAEAVATTKWGGPLDGPVQVDGPGAAGAAGGTVSVAREGSRQADDPTPSSPAGVGGEDPMRVAGGSATTTGPPARGTSNVSVGPLATTGIPGNATDAGSGDAGTVPGVEPATAIAPVDGQNPPAELSTTTTAVLAPATTAFPTTTTPAATTTEPASLTQLSGTWMMGSSGVGDVASQAVLPLANRSALNQSLPNFDTDRDTQPGLRIRRGGWGTVPGPARMQRFRLEQAMNVNIDGLVSARVYAAPAGLGVGSMSIGVAVARCSTVNDSCEELTRASAIFVGVLTGYQAVDIDLGDLNASFSATEVLEVWITAESPSTRDLLLAYDTVGYPSSLTVT